MRVTGSRAVALLLLAGWVLVGPSCGGGGGDEVRSQAGSPGAAVQTFFDRLNAGDLPEARDLYTTDAQMVVEDLEMFRDWADQITRDGSIDAVSIVSATVDGQTAAVEFELVFNDGTREEHTVDCMNENGVWKLGPVL